ncbi:MAG: hypothetical protein ICV63_01595 [Coleofasciculus sp. Co-bin14]|nr:hypothetical protein [Coleofasciculus sp. Co-bin14]
MNLPTLTTPETQRLRSDYPCIEHLEAGNVASWLMERQEQLLIRAKDERTGMNLAKLITLTGGAVGAVCWATSPLALIGGTLAGVGYVWAVARDLNDSHQFAPLPFIRGNFVEFLSAMGDSDAREEWFASQNELVDLMFHLSPIERYEFGMLKQFIPNLTDFLSGVEGGKRFYAYRWLLDWYINLKGSLPTQDALNKHLAAVTVDPRVNYQQVSAIQQHQSQMLLPPEPQFVELPQPQFAELPQPQLADHPGATIAKRCCEAQIETQAEVVAPIQNRQPAPTTPPVVAAPAPQVNLSAMLAMPPGERAIAILTQLNKNGFDVSRCIAEQITCIAGNQRGGKGTLMAILAILSCAIDPNTKIHYFTAGDDIYPFKCDRLVCRLNYPDLDGEQADRRVAGELYKYLKEMDKLSQGTCKDIILVIDEAVALSDYLDADQKQWMIRFLLSRANKKGAQIFIVLHGRSLTSWVGVGHAGGFSQTFKTGATFIGCEATSKKINPLRSISVATGRYFLADPDDFSKPVEGGNLGVVPDWLKTEINPGTGQPDPARTLLNFFPELRSDTQSEKTLADRTIETSNSEENKNSNLSATDPSANPSVETTLPERKLPDEKAEGSRKPDGISMEAFSGKITEPLAEASGEASTTLPPLFDDLDRDGKLLMLRLLLSKKIGKEKIIWLAWKLKSGGRSHDRYKLASELLEAMIKELSEQGFNEENNWEINH